MSCKHVPQAGRDLLLVPLMRHTYFDVGYIDVCFSSKCCILLDSNHNLWEFQQWFCQ